MSEYYHEQIYKEIDALDREVQRLKTTVEELQEQLREVRDTMHGKEKTERSPTLA